MRIANLSRRLHLLDGDLAIDVEKASDGQFGADPQAVYRRWADFTDWAAHARLPPGVPFDRRDLGSPAPEPAQVFAIGLNYDEHAAETGFTAPHAEPPVFTKFASSLAGPDCEVEIPDGGNVDWEVELVAVIGAPAHRVAAARAWSHVAGLTAGQDISERVLQMAAAPAQFSLGKSYPNFGPLGPWLVTPDEFTDPDDLELGCAINGETMQRGRTSQMIFPVAALVEKLSAVVPLRPGDVIFTGTPAGVGLGRRPQRWLRPGDELVSWIGGLGELRQRFVAAPVTTKGAL